MRTYKSKVDFKESRWRRKTTKVMKEEANQFSRFRADVMDVERPGEIRGKENTKIFIGGNSFKYSRGEERKQGEGSREMNIHLDLELLTER